MQRVLINHGKELALNYNLNCAVNFELMHLTTAQLHTMSFAWAYPKYIHSQLGGHDLKYYLPMRDELQDAIDTAT